MNQSEDNASEPQNNNNNNNNLLMYWNNVSNNQIVNNFPTNGNLMPQQQFYSNNLMPHLNKNGNLMPYSNNGQFMPPQFQMNQLPYNYYNNVNSNYNYATQMPSIWPNNQFSVDEQNLNVLRKRLSGRFFF